FAPADPERFPLLEAVQNVGLLWIDRNQRQFHWDGQVDYGDTLFHGYNTPSHYGYRAPTGWCSRGYVGWLNDDGGLTNAIFLHWLRTGDPRSWRLAENMARHSMDVDTVHWCAEQPEEIGGGHRHDQQHWGNGARGYGTATHGILDYYLLTGNERALEVARETAGYHDRGRGEDEDRIGGLIRFWEITGEPYWKKRADELLAEELKVPADKPWRFVTWPHFRMVSNTSTNFVYYLSAAPPADSAKLREAIVASAENSLGHYLSSWRDVSYLPLVVTSLAWQATRERRYAEATAALLQRLPLPRPRTVESGYLSALETLPFGEFAAAVTGRWQINNIYMLTIHGLAQLPYAQAALAAAGLDEQGLFAVKRVDDPAEPFEEVLTPARMSHEQGFAYQVALTHASPADKSGRSNLILLENGQPLGPAHSAHADIRAQGGGRYSHWYSTQLWFSASDNSDPRTNGREYKVVSPAP
ncbi:MAG: hypothetical protein HUU35_12045, partial [Armatimonadetes bacterium]|nr:hypothetical protein [Armatimonadota bacterium]